MGPTPLVPLLLPLSRRSPRQCSTRDHGGSIGRLQIFRRGAFPSETPPGPVLATLLFPGLVGVNLYLRQEVTDSEYFFRDFSHASQDHISRIMNFQTLNSLSSCRGGGNWFAARRPPCLTLGPFPAGASRVSSSRAKDGPDPFARSGFVRSGSPVEYFNTWGSRRWPPALLPCAINMHEPIRTSKANEPGDSRWVEKVEESR